MIDEGLWLLFALFLISSFKRVCVYIYRTPSPSPPGEFLVSQEGEGLTVHF